MTRRRVLLLVLAIATVSLGGASWLLLPPPITEENIARIQPGMTREEVVAILGAPRDECGSLELRCIVLSLPPLQEIASPDYDYWCGAKAAATVYYDDNGCVKGVGQGQVFGGEETILDRIRRWLGL